MSSADELKSALSAMEEALGDVIRRYRLALGCCCACGDHFEVGALVVTVVDTENHIAFEHEECPEETEDYRSDYRFNRQLGP